MCQQHPEALVKSFKLITYEGCTNHDSNILNLSNYKLSRSEINILNKGLKFIPTPHISRESIDNATKDIVRKFKLQHYFQFRSHTEKLPFTGKSKFSPPDEKIDQKVLDFTNRFSNEIKKIKIKKETNNIPKEEYQALVNLGKNTDVIIKSADKGSITVIMDRTNYLHEGYRQLSNPQHYLRINKPIYFETAKRIKQILLRLLEEYVITSKQLGYLLPPPEPRPRRFYMLPKIHKPPGEWTIPNKMPKGRPIISDCNSVSEKVAEYIDSFLKTKASEHPSYVKDTYDFINKIKHSSIPSSALFITLDVESMYTNILHKNGLESVKEAFKSWSNQPMYQGVIELLELCLNSNDFEFDGNWFIQNSGTTMGTKWSPHYADIHMARFEKEALAKCANQPFLYLRYLDDIFIVWQHGRKAFLEFLRVFNCHQPPIKFKSTIHDNSIDFLDTTIYKDPTDPSRILTKVYFKPTDIHQLLEKTSFHPRHTFAGILKSQITRFYRICSEQSEFENAWSILYRSSAKRKYSKRWMRRIKFKTVLELKYQALETEPCSSNPGSSKSGCFRCNKSQCVTCDIITECQNFISATTGEIFSINSKMNCDSKNLIYLYSCKLCRHQYVGETNQTLRERANGHRYEIRRKNKDHPLYSHLLNFHFPDPYDNHDDDNFTLTPIESIEDSGSRIANKLERLKRESYWIVLLGTLKPYGLNKKSIEFLKTPLNRIMPFVVPFSKTANLAAEIIKKHFELLKSQDEIYDLDFKIVTAYTRHNNLSSYLVHSKIR